MGVSKNSGTPKSATLIGFSIINHPLWGTPIFGNTHMFYKTGYNSREAAWLSGEADCECDHLSHWLNMPRTSGKLFTGLFLFLGPGRLIRPVRDLQSGKVEPWDFMGGMGGSGTEHETKVTLWYSQGIASHVHSFSHILYIDVFVLV